MGGGGVLRAATAAKVAGIGVVNRALRATGFSAIPKCTDQPMMRSMSGPVSPTILSASQSDIADVPSVQRSSLGINDREYAGGGGVGGGEPMARLVFGGPPSLQEVKDATSELKDALDKAYMLSPESSGSDRPFAFGHLSDLSLLTDAECSDNKSYVTCDPKASAVSNFAVQAFSLLNKSPAAQSVVVSIASDPNVWQAVMGNDAVREYINSYNTNAVLQYAESQSSDENQSGNTGSTLMDILENIKLSVVDMISNVSAYVQNMFGYSSAENSYADDYGKPRSLGTAFMALALMVIMAVVLKRT